MKATKYVLIAAGIVVVLAVIAWLLRDNLIQRISNPLLEDYGISVTDVSLDALAGDGATIGYLELVHDKGTTIAIENLTLPIGVTPGATRTYTAKKVSIVTSTRTDGEPFEMAQLINQFISLPGNLDDSEIVVTEFRLPPYPTVYDLRWTMTDGEQALLGTIDDIVMSATILQTGATQHSVAFSLPGRSTPSGGHIVTADLYQRDKGILVRGMSAIDLSAWDPVARMAGIVPREIGVASGSATAQFDIEIPADARQSPVLAANVAPSPALQLTYAGAPDNVVSILVESASPVELVATFPAVEWSLHQAKTSLLFTYGEWQNIPLFLNDLTCRSGPVCSMETRLTMDAAELPIGTFDRVEFVSTESIRFRDAAVLIEVSPGAALSMTAITVGGAEVERFEGQVVSGASLELMDAGWTLAADSVDVKIEAASLPDDIAVTMPLFLENILISEIDSILSSRFGLYAPSGTATLKERTVALPGFKGELSLQGSDVAADLMTVGLHRDGAVKASHNFDTGGGRLNVSGTAVSFETQRLSRRVSPWPVDRDLVAGTAAFDLDADWIRKGASLELGVLASVATAELSGYVADTAFAGLSTQLNVAYRSATGFVTQPSTVTVALIETGIAVENLRADYTLELNVPGVDVRNLRMVAFGGVIRADPFSYRTETESNNLTLHADSIELAELLSLAETEAIEVSGSIGATLPLTIEGDTVTIADGTLTGDPAGGVIRYLAESAPDEADASAIGLVRRALSNFEFDTLTSDVDLTREGDLNLRLRLTGRNPDLDENRPVVLNLSVENNVPQMLKSLRAARAVEEILERRLRE